MKKLSIILTLVFGVALFSCGDDKEKDDPKCLTCTGTDDDSDFEGLCVGLEDPDTGETLTETDLQAAATLLEAFGADCTVD